MSGVEGNRVKLLLGKIPRIRGDRPLVVTACQQNRSQQTKYTKKKTMSHTDSFDNAYSQIQYESDDHRPK